MDVARRIVIMAEMHGRDLLRRHVALALLVALPLSFYLASAGSGLDALPAGGVGMAFAVGGAALFSALSSLEVDQRLVLCGYRPVDLLLGRLMFLGPLGIVIAGGFTALMAVIAHPSSPGILLLGVVTVAVLAVPFGLAVAAIVPRELEGTLLLIGVVGVQLAVGRDTVLAKALPFYGSRQLIETGAVGHGPVAAPLWHTGLYALGLFLVARAFVGPRLSVRRHGSIPTR